VSATVLLTDGAARDLDELYAAAYDRGGAVEADRFLDRIQVVFERLAAAPTVGRPPPALQRLGVVDGLQVRDHDLRLLYRMRDEAVLLVAIASAERSMASLLQRRMLDA
jgi:toxin ParE1/3/4